MPPRFRRSLYPSSDTVDTFLTQSSGQVTARHANLPHQVGKFNQEAAIKIMGDEVALKLPSTSNSKR